MQQTSRTPITDALRQQLERQRLEQKRQQLEQQRQQLERKREEQQQQLERKREEQQQRLVRQLERQRVEQQQQLERQKVEEQRRSQPNIPVVYSTSVQNKNDPSLRECAYTIPSNSNDGDIIKNIGNPKISIVVPPGVRGRVLLKVLPQDLINEFEESSESVQSIVLKQEEYVDIYDNIKNDLSSNITNLSFIDKYLETLDGCATKWNNAMYRSHPSTWKFVNDNEKVDTGTSNSPVGPVSPVYSINDMKANVNIDTPNPIKHTLLFFAELILTTIVTNQFLNNVTDNNLANKIRLWNQNLEGSATIMITKFIEGRLEIENMVKSMFDYIQTKDPTQKMQNYILNTKNRKQSNKGWSLWGGKHRQTKTRKIKRILRGRLTRSVVGPRKRGYTKRTLNKNRRVA
jgi:hypothetical protein